MVDGMGPLGNCSPSGFTGADPGCSNAGAFVECTPVTNQNGKITDCIASLVTMTQECH
jgi:hypothetical protein